MCVDGEFVVSGCEYVVFILLMSGIGAMFSCGLFVMFMKCLLDFWWVLAKSECEAIVGLLWRVL